MGAISLQKEKEMKQKRSIIMFYDLLQLINSLDVTDAGLIIKSLIDYEMTGFVWDWQDSNLKYIYDIGVTQLDRGRELFDQRYGDNNGR